MRGLCLFGIVLKVFAQRQIAEVSVTLHATGHGPKVWRWHRICVRWHRRAGREGVLCILHYVQQIPQKSLPKRDSLLDPTCMRESGPKFDVHVLLLKRSSPFPPSRSNLSRRNC